MSNIFTSQQTKSLLSFAKDSAKKSFLQLKKEQFFFCTYMSEKVSITRLFFQHVVFKDSRARTPYEIMERILIFPFLSDIIKNGIAQKTHSINANEFYKVSKKYNKYSLSVILLRNKTGQLVLLSCFKDFNVQKKRTCLRT